MYTIIFFAGTLALAIAPSFAKYAYTREKGRIFTRNNLRNYYELERKNGGIYRVKEAPKNVPKLEAPSKTLEIYLEKLQQLNQDTETGTKKSKMSYNKAPSTVKTPCKYPDGENMRYNNNHYAAVVNAPRFITRDSMSTSNQKTRWLMRDFPQLRAETNHKIVTGEENTPKDVHSQSLTSNRQDKQINDEVSPNENMINIKQIPDKKNLIKTYSMALSAIKPPPDNSEVLNIPEKSSCMNNHDILGSNGRGPSDKPKNQVPKSAFTSSLEKPNHHKHSNLKFRLAYASPPSKNNFLYYDDIFNSIQYKEAIVNLQKRKSNKRKANEVQTYKKNVPVA